MNNEFIVHYHSSKDSYDDLSLWQLQDKKADKELYFSTSDSFGAIATFHCAPFNCLTDFYLSFKSKSSGHKLGAYQIKCQTNSTEQEMWLLEGDGNLYYSRQAAIASPFYSKRQADAFDMVLNSQAFDKKWGFSGWLGFRYKPEETLFRLWAPTAKSIEVILYQSADKDSEISLISPMQRGKKENPDNHLENTQGLWELSLKGNYNFQAYSYRVHYQDGHFADSRDPYSIASSADGRKSIILAEENRVPEGFSVKHGQAATWRLDNPNQAVIYEMHVRDFSTSESSGVSEKNRGKFLGLIEPNTKNQYGDTTGFDYIKSLGVTHIQLQPVFDHHQTIDESGNYAYNWGYDPENYNVPEASFTSNPHKPETRILELKSAIQAYHDAGLNVIIDVVYNHTYSSKDSAFQLTVPDYYYRLNPDGSFQNGSGCGNETASEKEMFRKYMVDSVLYWLNEYNVDGFRFDLMGLHDIETMNQIRQEVDKFDPRILIYGEGWDMGHGLAPEDKAKKTNASRMPRIGFFNDDQRNAIKGAEIFGMLEEGFVSGMPCEDTVSKALLGSRDLVDYVSPDQVINYVEAHDNYNLNDLLWVLHPNDSKGIHRKRVQLANAMNLLTQGLSFMQIGQEFLRTKLVATGKNKEVTVDDHKRAMNSYKAPDIVNQVDWNLISQEAETIWFVKKLIALKTKSTLFSYPSFEEIRNHVFGLTAERHSGFLSYFIRDQETYQLMFTNSDHILKEQKDSQLILSSDASFSPGKNSLHAFSTLVFKLKK